MQIERQKAHKIFITFGLCTYYDKFLHHLKSFPYFLTIMLLSLCGLLTISNYPKLNLPRHTLPTTQDYRLMLSAAKIHGFFATLLGFIILGITGIPYCVLLLLLLPWRAVRIKLGNYYGHAVGPILIALTGSKMTVNNKERLDPKRPALYVTNHSSNLDPLIAISICPIGGCGISKKQIAYTPFFGLVYLLSGHLLIGRRKKNPPLC